VNGSTDYIVAGLNDEHFQTTVHTKPRKMAYAPLGVKRLNLKSS